MKHEWEKLSHLKLESIRIANAQVILTADMEEWKVISFLREDKIQILHLFPFEKRADRYR